MRKDTNAHPRHYVKHHSILVIEYSNVFANALKKGLKSLHYHVIVASTLHQALDILTQHAFDLIVLDLNLPDGEDELILQNLNFVEKLKILIYTSDTDKDRRHEWFRYGVLGYLSKSSPLPSVIKEIDNVMNALRENTFYSILIIDDSKFICNQISALLQPRNYRLSIANSAEEAKAYLSVKQFDLIILDLELPDEHGTHVLDAIRTTQSALSTPIFILTGKESSFSIGELLKKGANEFFMKPFSPELLLHKIDLWIDIKKTHYEKEKDAILLKEYKSAIDQSTIISKTTPQGIITYVNDQFCKISGYTSEELIGKPHNIVRHPEMSKEIFHELWETIKKKRRWHGVVKNRKKDGSPYWVDAYIHPILNGQGDVQEFIAIRYDVTPLYIMKENLRKSLQISDNNLDQISHISKQYESIINETSSVVRVNPEGKVLFVNQRFCELSGYSKKEILGTSVNQMYAKDIDQELLASLWDRVKQGLIWKGMLKNQRKDGSIYWVKATVVPIKDTQGTITEYMSIRSDITEVIKLHEEIEATQQEVIYRMGEIAESRSKETGNHVKRVAEYSRLLAQKYGLDIKEANLIADASPMHDIGKVGIPDAILHKPGKLTSEEWDIMRTHAMLGYNILQNSNRSLLQTAAIIAKEHHEKYDGSGYPEGHKGDKIHLYARIVAIADVFDALSHDRCYKKAWEDDKIFEFFESKKGKHFDPLLTDLFLASKQEFLDVRNALRDIVVYD